MRNSPARISSPSHRALMLRRYAGGRRCPMTWRTERCVAAGAAGGLVAGLVSGVLLQLVHMTTMEGVRQPAMGLVAGAVHTAWAPLAWAGYVAYATLIGAAFGWLLRWQHVGAGSGVVWGVLYGGVWGVVSW